MHAVTIIFIALGSRGNFTLSIFIILILSVLCSRKTNLFYFYLFIFLKYEIKITFFFIPQRIYWVNLFKHEGMQVNIYKHSNGLSSENFKLHVMQIIHEPIKVPFRITGNTLLHLTLLKKKDAFLDE